MRKRFVKPGFLEAWESQGVGNIQVFLNIFKQRV